MRIKTALAFITLIGLCADVSFASLCGVPSATGPHGCGYGSTGPGCNSCNTSDTCFDDGVSCSPDCNVKCGSASACTYSVCDIHNNSGSCVGCTSDWDCQADPCYPWHPGKDFCDIASGQCMAAATPPPVIIPGPLVPAPMPAPAPVPVPPAPLPMPIPAPVPPPTPIIPIPAPVIPAPVPPPVIPPPVLPACAADAYCGNVTSLETGGVLPFIVITLRNSSGGVLTHTETNAAGDYVFTGLTPGNKYYVHVEASRKWGATPSYAVNTPGYSTNFVVRGVEAKVSFTGVPGSAVLISTFSYDTASMPVATPAHLSDYYMSVMSPDGKAFTYIPSRVWYYTCYVPHGETYVKSASRQISAASLTPQSEYSVDDGGNPLRCL